MSRPVRLARNTVLNLAGFTAPLLAAIASIPWLIHGLGPVRFGVLTLAWAAIGYFGFFDLGLGRALTHAVASRLGSEGEGELAALGWTALLAMAALGAVGGATLALATPWLVRETFKVPLELASEASHASYLLAATLPIVVATAGLRGIIEAHQHFGIATSLRVPLSVASYVGPLLVLPLTNRLEAIVAVLCVIRVIGCVAHLVVCLNLYAFLRRRPLIRRTVLVPLLRVGGWMTISNVVSPLMSYFDRFLIGAVLPLTAVAYYVTPYEAVMKLTILPTALVGVLFPAFAESFARDRERTLELFEVGVRVVVVALFPVVLVVVTLASEALHLWVGADFARAGTPVLQWLAFGVLINSVGFVAFVVLQGVGRPDLTGKLNLAELPLYAVGLWVMIQHFGLAGVALAWTLRVLIDTGALWLFALRQLRTARTPRTPILTWLAMAASLLAGALLPNTPVRLTYAGLGLLAYVPLAWFAIMTPGDRALLRRLMRRALPLAGMPRQAA